MSTGEDLARALLRRLRLQEGILRQQSELIDLLLAQQKDIFRRLEILEHRTSPARKLARRLGGGQEPRRKRQDKPVDGEES